MNPYETPARLNDYLLFHYGRPRDQCPFPFAPPLVFDFHRSIITQCLQPLRFSSPTRGLDVGCAVGRLTFELAQVVDEAVGIDRSRAFIRAARLMARTHQVRVRRRESGTRFSELTVRLPRRLGPGRPAFAVGDAQDLSRYVRRAFHVVLAVNLICRLPQPTRFLDWLPDRVVPGGQLVIASPGSWLAAYTPRRRWLTSAAIQQRLRPAFRLVGRRDLPFLIREHRRKYEWVVAEVLTFVRRPIA